MRHLVGHSVGVTAGGRPPVNALCVVSFALLVAISWHPCRADDAQDAREDGLRSCLENFSCPDPHPELSAPLGWSSADGPPPDHCVVAKVYCEKLLRDAAGHDQAALKEIAVYRKHSAERREIKRRRALEASITPEERLAKLRAASKWWSGDSVSPCSKSLDDPVGSAQMMGGLMFSCEIQNDAANGVVLLYCVNRFGHHTTTVFAQDEATCIALRDRLK